MFNRDVKGIIENTFYLYLVQGLNYLLPLLVLPYLIKTLSVDSFGIYSFAFAFSQFVLLFVDFGFNISATKKIAENSRDILFVRNYFWIIITIKIVLSLISLIIVIVLIFTVGKIGFYSDAILWSFLMVFGTVFFPLWWFQGLNQMRQMSMINAASKILSYPLIFLFVKKSSDYNIAIIIQSMSFVLASLFSIVYIWRTHPHYFQLENIFASKNSYTNEIKDSFGIFLSNSSISLYTNSLTILLGFFSNNYYVGLFGAMERIVRVICSGVLGPINQACYPIVVQMKKENFNSAKILVRKIIFVVICLLLASYVAVYFSKKFLFEKLFSEYGDIESIFFTFLTMIFPIALGGIIGNLGLLGLGGAYEKKIFSKIYIVVGVISLPISIVSIKIFNIWGAVGAMIIVELLIFFSLLMVVRKKKMI